MLETKDRFNVWFIEIIFIISSIEKIKPFTSQEFEIG